MLWALAALLGVAFIMDERERKAVAPASTQRAKMIALVRAEAQRQGLPDPLALAVVEVESNFNPAAAGDKGWAEKRPELYKRLVLDNPKLKDNPARTDARAWHSYGLFQLLAPHHIRGSEHPELLYDPRVNAERGVAYLKGLLRKYEGDTVKVRLAYAGALNASQAEQDRVLGRFSTAYTKWHDLDAGGLA